MYVAPGAIAVDNLSEQDGATIPKLRNEPAELVTGIRHRQWLATFSKPIARKHFYSLLGRKLGRINPQLARQWFVHPNQSRRGYRCR